MKLKKSFILRSIVGENVLVPTGETAKEFNGMISLTETAATIWKNIEKVETEEEMVAIILDEYEVPRELAERDVHGFLTMMRAKGMLE